MVSQKKQVKRLKKNAQRLWSDQQDLLGRANSTVRDAVPHAQHFAQDKLGQVVPGARSIYDDKVAPSLDRGAKVGKAAGKYAASTTKDAVRGTALPAVTSALAAAVAIAREAGESLGLSDTAAASKAKDASKKLDKLTRSGERSGKKARVKIKAATKAGKLAVKHGPKVLKHRKGIGAGGVIGIILGAGVLAGIGYAVWQTLRADDDLWVADEDPETAATSEPPTA